MINYVKHYYKEMKIKYKSKYLGFVELCLNCWFSSKKKKESNLPLKPSECALAMLPYHGRQYIPESIQHLMEPDSPIGDLYMECEVKLNVFVFLLILFAIRSAIVYPN